MLILAVVAIRAVSNDGIISHAKNARAEYEKAQGKELAILESYLDKIVEIPIEETQKETMLSKETNSVTFDKYGNKIVVPAGFKILVDSTTDYKADTIDVTKGIVITDAVDESGKSIGNEFVWIPVGDVYTTEEKEKTESNTTTIELKRYVFNNNGTINESLTQTEPGGRLGDSYDYYTEDLEDSKTSNAHAKDIVAFKTSAIKNHGYYIGRYEAGKENNILVCKANKTVYANVTQPKASELSQSMYTNKPYESDLINSYAWDTAIVFIQKFGANGVGGKEPDSSTYSRENKSTRFAKTGINPDKYRNIYDMSGNAYEWSTETSTSNYSSGPCTLRGGFYYADVRKAYNYPSHRSGVSTTSSGSYYAFRPLLYV